MQKISTEIMHQLYLILTQNNPGVSISASTSVQTHTQSTDNQSKIYHNQTKIFTPSLTHIHLAYNKGKQGKGCEQNGRRESEGERERERESSLPCARRRQAVCRERRRVEPTNRGLPRERGRMKGEIGRKPSSISKRF